MEPAAGSLACGAVGLGRLPEPDLIVEAAARPAQPPGFGGAEGLGHRRADP